MNLGFRSSLPKHERDQNALVNLGGFITLHAHHIFDNIAKDLGVAEIEIRRFTENMPWTDLSPRHVTRRAGVPSRMRNSKAPCSARYARL